MKVPNPTRTTPSSSSMRLTGESADGAGRQSVYQAERRAIGRRKLPDADARSHDVRDVGGMIEAEKVSHLVQRDRLDRGGTERVALMVVEGERDAALDDPPAVIASPARLAADGLVEPLAPGHVNVRPRGVGAELEGDGDPDGCPLREGALDDADVRRVPPIEVRRGLDPDPERPTCPVGPTSDIRVAALEDLGDVRTRFSLAQTLPDAGVVAPISGGAAATVGQTGEGDRSIHALDLGPDMRDRCPFTARASPGTEHQRGERQRWPDRSSEARAGRYGSLHRGGTGGYGGLRVATAGQSGTTRSGRRTGRAPPRRACGQTPGERRFRRGAGGSRVAGRHGPALRRARHE